MKNFWGSLSGREKTLLIWAVVSTVVALVAITGWVWRLQPMATVWGDIGTWFAGAVTLLGLVYAGRSLRLQTEQRRAEDDYRRGEEERRLSDDERDRAAEFRIQRAAALAVSLGTPSHRFRSGNDYQYTLLPRLVNGGKSPIHNVTIVVARGNQEPEEFTRDIIPAGGSFAQRAQWVSDERFDFADPNSTASAYFTDDWGNRWKRTHGQLHKARHDSSKKPEN